MNSNLKLIIVAFTSFLFGVVATYTYQSSELSDPVLTPRQKELQKIAIEAERSPFFPSPAQSTSTPLIEQSQSEKINPVVSEPERGFDYIKSNAAVRDFQKRVDAEDSKRFEFIDISQKMHSRKKDYILGKVDYFLSSKNVVFKASYSGQDIGLARLIFIMRFYSCNDAGTETHLSGKSTLDNSCYSFTTYSYLNGKWNHYTSYAYFRTSEWLDDVLHIGMNFEEMGDFSKETNILRAYVPIADDGGIIKFLRYKNNRFEWIDSGDLKWSESSVAEAQKYQKLAIPGFKLHKEQ